MMPILRRAACVAVACLVLNSPLATSVVAAASYPILAAQQSGTKSPRVYTNDDPIFNHPPSESRSEAQEEPASTPPEVPSERAGGKIAPFVPTPVEVVDKMLAAAEVTSSDVVYDLGSGDGRIVIQAARDYGAKAVGVEIDRRMVEESLEKVREAKMDLRVKIIQGDLLKTNFSGATVVTLYLLPAGIEKLRPILERDLTPGTRVVTHDMRIPRWEAVSEEQITLGTVLHTVYLYRVPDAFQKK